MTNTPGFLDLCAAEARARAGKKTALDGKSEGGALRLLRRMVEDESAKKATLEGLAGASKLPFGAPAPALAPLFAALLDAGESCALDLLVAVLRGV